MEREAQWWTKEDDSVRCLLCPHACLIAEGKRGYCGARGAESGGMRLPGYGRITSWGSDPIEKKPLYHFHPGETIWSAGFAGCNMNCPFCQNHGIARAKAEQGVFRSPADLIGDVLRNGSRMIAYTYSEPTIHYEYLIDCADLASESGLKNVLVTNGNLNKKPASLLLNAMDAVNIDFKSWNSGYYRRVLGGDLSTVKDFFDAALESCWVELTTLVVPDDNDSENEFRNMVTWIASRSDVTPLHLSAYHPAYRYTRPPTNGALLRRLKALADEKLKYVYLGNLGDVNDTICSGCGKRVIHRRNYSTTVNLKNGCCPDCGTATPGVYET